MLTLQQKGELHLCLVKAAVNSKNVYFFFSTLTSVTAIQESVLYLHGDTLPGIVTKKSTEENCSMHNLVGWIRSLFYSF